MQDRDWIVKRAQDGLAHLALAGPEFGKMLEDDFKLGASFARRDEMAFEGRKSSGDERFAELRSPALIFCERNGGFASGETSLEPLETRPQRHARPGQNGQLLIEADAMAYRHSFTLAELFRFGEGMKSQRGIDCKLR